MLISRATSAGFGSRRR